MERILIGAVLLFLTVGVLPASQDSSGGKLAVKNLDLNTQADEIDPHLSGDSLRLFYASNAAGKFDLMVSDRPRASMPWPAGKPLSELSSQVDDLSPCLVSTNGRFPQFLYFATKTDKEINNFDIYFAVRHKPGDDFAAPTPVHSVCTEDDELHPWVTANGRELYFSRHSKEGWRTYVASRPGDGAFGEPKQVELPLGFHHPTLSPDGATMYVQGPLEKERWGLFRCTRSSAKGAWSQPEELRDLNCPDALTGDRAPSLNREGSLLYFSSDRPGGKGGLDIWAVSVADLKQ
jgi:hypothetical protein